VSVSYDSPSQTSDPKAPADPIDTSIKLVAAGLAFLILLVIGASASNSFKYYLKENQGALEVWKGKFAPLGEKLIVSLPGVSKPEDAKNFYKSDDVFPMIFEQYINKADALLDVSGIPDFEGIKGTLKTALAYGSTDDLREQAYQRLDNIDRLVLVYKADVAASKGTVEDMEAAIEFLNDAKKLTTEKNQETLIVQKISSNKTALADLKIAAEQAAATQAEADKAAAEAAQATEAAEAAETEASDEEAPAEETIEAVETETEAETH
jgi:colicin import membrane protein